MFRSLSYGCSYQIPEPQFNESDIVIPTIPRRIRRAPLSSVAAADSVCLSPAVSTSSTADEVAGAGPGPSAALSGSTSSQPSLEGSAAGTASSECPNRQALLKHFRQNYCKPVKLRHEQRLLFITLLIPAYHNYTQMVAKEIP